MTGVVQYSVFLCLHTRGWGHSVSPQEAGTGQRCGAGLGSGPGAALLTPLCAGCVQVIELRRPMDSRLEHVDFECLFKCLSVRQIIRIFASLLLERRVIFVADKLR